jgi:hypothetical protein
MEFKTSVSPPQFDLGQLVATPAALGALTKAGVSAFEYVARHLRGDWGDLDRHDRQENENALLHGDRILSAYRLPDGVKIWIITEADRASTCVLLPDDY